MKYYFLFSLLMIVSFASAQDVRPLYPNEIPNSKNPDSENYKNNIPTLYIYKPESVTKNKAFLIIPGGGYAHVAINHEGHDVAKALNKEGYVAVVLKYRLPSNEIMEDKRFGPIQDAQSAIKFIRDNKEALGLAFDEVGVLGFSAGGHLASTLSTHYNHAYIENQNNTSLKPDFSVLLYPVISMDPDITHEGSKKNLIGPSYSDEDVSNFSNELLVDKNSPRAYLMHAKDDKVVVLENSERYAKALDKHAVKNKVYIYEKGGHGFGLKNKQEDGDWFADMLNWIEN
ncbi:alpha/beta hydrolase [Sphingobacterium hungaricum]|uniref:Alpha/beta hydrolase n=1 Tax=Sphingobacterium hungaricum TaxID=2082723 RepID=A0A928UVP6_9SPHI|nr:alpha/beta hydrolase [Sphingobacterium hungaricum]MBE8713813.1 alpha/beta hydrolase [Sphingobacterium hungaricum]